MKYIDFIHYDENDYTTFNEMVLKVKGVIEDIHSLLEIKRIHWNKDEVDQVVECILSSGTGSYQMKLSYENGLNDEKCVVYRERKQCKNVTFRIYL